jgi:Lar family restriction alleviation protein
MSKLKPCPFCGEKATLDYSVMPNRKHWFITCDCCGMMYQYTLSQRKYVKDGWNTRPIEDALTARIAELEAENDRLQGAWFKDETICPDGSLKPKVSALLSRIAELEAEIDQLTADSTDERKDDKLLEREVCEACGGDGTLLLTDGYEGQVMATVKCIYCNGTGRVNKECEE